MANILIIEDETTIAELERDYFEAQRIFRGSLPYWR